MVRKKRNKWTMIVMKHSGEKAAIESVRKRRGNKSYEGEIKLYPITYIHSVASAPADSLSVRRASPTETLSEQDVTTSQDVQSPNGQESLDTLRTHMVTYAPLELLRCIGTASDSTDAPIVSSATTRSGHLIVVTRTRAEWDGEVAFHFVRLVLKMRDFTTAVNAQSEYPTVGFFSNIYDAAAAKECHFHSVRSADKGQIRPIQCNVH